MSESTKKSPAVAILLSIFGKQIAGSIRLQYAVRSLVRSSGNLDLSPFLGFVPIFGWGRVESGVSTWERPV